MEEGELLSHTQPDNIPEIEVLQKREIVTGGLSRTKDSPLDLDI